MERYLNKVVFFFFQLLECPDTTGMPVLLTATTIPTRGMPKPLMLSCLLLRVLVLLVFSRLEVSVLAVQCSVDLWWVDRPCFSMILTRVACQIFKFSAPLEVLEACLEICVASPHRQSSWTERKSRQKGFYIMLATTFPKHFNQYFLSLQSCRQWRRDNRNFWEWRFEDQICEWTTPAAPHRKES